MEENFYRLEYERGIDDGLFEVHGDSEDAEFEELLENSASDEIEAEDDEATAAARGAFGVKFLFPWQRMVISNILDASRNIEADPTFSERTDDDEFCRGRQIVLLPTGAGKSMCFLVPSLLLPGATLVFYPLLALMADQKRRMDDGGISCVMFRGGQTAEEREENFRRIGGGARVILANPEVLQDERLLDRLSKCRISHVAIDEAHCVSEWGDSFRPAYLTLGKIIGRLGVKVVTAFTATASPPVLSRVGEVLFGGHFHLLKSDSDRANIHYSVLFAEAKGKAALHCARTMRRPMIIFCSSRKRTEDMVRSLSEIFGRERAKFYHAGLTKEEKDSVEKWFFDSDDGVLAATCAYGMGMDKGNIYSVVHLDAPEHLENFVQEAGRGGRKGDDVRSVLIWSRADTERWKAAARGSRERAMGDFALSRTCRRQAMLDLLGGEKTVCSGCDVCDARKVGRKISTFPADAALAYSVIRRKRSYLTKTGALEEIGSAFGKRMIGVFGINVWEEGDSDAILSSLFGMKKIRIGAGLWRGRILVSGKTPPLQWIFSRFLRLLRRFPATRPLPRLPRRLRRTLLRWSRAAGRRTSSALSAFSSSCSALPRKLCRCTGKPRRRSG